MAAFIREQFHAGVGALAVSWQQARALWLPPSGLGHERCLFPVIPSISPSLCKAQDTGEVESSPAALAASLQQA
jgi:hypothetical protein